MNCVNYLNNQTIPLQPQNTTNPAKLRYPLKLQLTLQSNYAFQIIPPITDLPCHHIDDGWL
jgi:hypothetical protein